MVNGAVGVCVFIVAWALTFLFMMLNILIRSAWRSGRMVAIML